MPTKHIKQTRQVMAIPNLENVSLIEKLRFLPFVTFLFVGIGLLWPWNNILSATLYFQNNLSQSTTIYAKIFTSSMMTISTVTSLFFNIYLSNRQHSYNQRVTRGLIWQISTFIALTLLSFITTTVKDIPMWLTFALIMCLVGVSAISTALTQNGIMAIANVFGSQFSQSVMLGQAVAGVLPSIVLFFVALINKGGNSEDNEDETMNSGGILFYFMTTAFVCLASIGLYRVTNINDMLMSMTSDLEYALTEDHALISPPTQSSNTVEEEEEIEEAGNLLLPLKESTVPLPLLYEKLKYLVLSIFSTFVVTLIFPVFAATVRVSKLPLANTQYIPLVFTVWNIGDLYGRVLADLPVFRHQKFTPKMTFIYSLSRIICIPFFFYFTVKSITQHAHSLWLDCFYIILQFIFGVTNGHVISISFMKVPEQLDTDEEKEAAGGLTSVFVSVGLAVGSLVSYIFVAMISGLEKV